MKRLFVLSGGGPAGIDIHAGILKAMKEAGLIPDFWVGNSAGSVVASYSATHAYDPDAMITFVKTLNNSLLDYRNLWYLRIPYLDSIMSNTRIHKALKAALPLDIPSNLNVWATKLPDLTKVNVADPNVSPDLPTAVLASMSIHGIWPVVRLKDGYDYTDGGFRFNLPYDDAVYPDFDEVWLLVGSGKPNKYIAGQKNLLTIAQQDISWLVENSTLTVLEKYVNTPKVKVVWPLIDSPNLSFDHSLIEKAYDEAKKQISSMLVVANTPTSLKLYKKSQIANFNMYRHQN
jgi:predicted acylesterase/phospholipase RssA